MPRKQTTIAKLSRPRLHSPVARERLFQLIDKKRHHPVIWVSGPPGAGKTTLAASYLEEAGVPAIWYHVDSGDSDPATFFLYLKQAFEAYALKLAKPLPLLTPEYLSDLPGFAKRFLRAGFARLPDEVIVAFDNYHDLAPESRLHQAFKAFLAEVPERANLLVLSRLPPLPIFAQAIANQTMGLISWEELRLSENETVAIGNQAGITDSEVLLNLHEQSTGWPAGVTLMLERMRCGYSLEGPQRLDALQTIFDYFADLALENISSEALAVLMNTALVPRLDGELAEALTGVPDAIRHLEELHRRHLFINRSASNPITYEYHGLFRTFLQNKARSEFSASDWQRLVQRSAVLLQRQGEADAAFTLFVEAEDWASAEQIIVHLATQLIAQGRWQTLGRWIETLPPARAKAAPWLQYWLGRSQVFVAPPLARTILERTYELFARSGNESGQLVAAAAILEALYYDFRDFRSMDSWIHCVVKLLDRDVAIPTREDALRVYSSLMMGATYRVPDHPQLPAWVEKIKELMREPLDPNLRVSTASMLYGYGHMIIDHELERFAAQVAEPLLSSSAVTAWPASFFIALTGFTHYAYGRHDDALACFDRAEKIASENGLADLLIKIGVWRGLCCRRAGMLDEAEEAIRRIEPLCLLPTASVASPMDFVRACVAFDRGDMETAVKGVLRGVPVSMAGGQYNAMMLVRLVCANILIGAREFDRADELLRSVRHDIPVTDVGRYGGVAALNEAWLAHRQGLAEPRDRLLREAMQRAVDYRDRQRFRWYPNALAELLPIALTRGIESDTARQLAAEFRVVPIGSASADWPWPIRIYALGRFDLLLNGQRPQYGRKVPKKALALLKALIALGCNEVPEQRLLDAIWPDEDGDVAAHLLTATLHRLRRLLPIAAAIRQKGGALTLDMRYCWVDAREFEDRLAQDDATADTLTLYQGPFLAQEDASWVLAARERLRSKFVHVVAKLGGALERSGQHETAIDLYTRGIEADHLVESFYQGLMRCYGSLNRMSEAASAYRRLRDALSITLGVQPSSVTQQLFETLRLHGVSKK